MMQTGDIVAEHYEVDRIIGRGGTSVVYRAYDLKAERAVRAVKEISKENIDVYEMAKRESKLIKELYERDKSNGFVPNIIEVYDRYSDRLYIIQDYLDGETLDDMLEVAPMPHDVFIDAAKQICAFMKFFHDTGRVHSDMKPENIMVLKPNPTLGNNKESKTRMKLKFIDFGTAIRNEGNSTEGYGYTPEYAAPEQYRNAGIDERTDIYNIGATFFHMIQGRKPLSVSMENRMRSSAERFRFDKNINAELKRIIQKCVADNPDERFKSCDALYKALNQIENHTHMRLLIILFSLMIVSFAGSAFSMYMSESLSTENNINTYSEKINEGDYAAAIQIDHTTEVTFESELAGLDEDKFSIEEALAKKFVSEPSLEVGKMAIYICPGISVNLRVKLSLEASGKLEVKVTTANTKGFEMKGSSFRAINETSTTQSLALTGEAGAYMTLILALSLDYLVGEVDLLNLELKVGPTLTASVTVHNAEGTEKDMLCIDVSGYLKIELKLILLKDLMELLDMEASLTLYDCDADSSPIKFFGIHLENFKFTDGCTFEEETTESTETETIPVGIFALEDSYLSIDVGSSATITIKSLPSGYSASDIIWESSDPSKVSVDANGNVTAVTAGSAGITAKTSDGKYSVSCAVNARNVINVSYPANGYQADNYEAVAA